jgi:predicted RND superfamily exporter protein
MSLPELVARRPVLVLAVGAAVTVLALLPAASARLDSRIENLLPAGSPASRDYRLFLETFGGLEKVFVLVTAAEAPAPSRRATAADLVAAARMLRDRLEPSAEVASVRCGVEPEDEAFFLEQVVSRAPLLLGDDWRASVTTRLEPEAIRRQVARIRAELLAPTGSLRAPLITADPLGFSTDLGVMEALHGGLPVDPASLTFLSVDGDASLLIVQPSRAEIDPEGGRALAAELDRAFREVAAASRKPLRFAAVGGPLYAAQDEAVLRSDLKRTVSGSVIACSVLLLAAFGGPTLPAAALATLAVALLWTAGLIGLGLGQVSAVGVAFAAIIIGLGIDYAIHGGTRHREALLDGANAASGMRSVFRHAGPAIVTSAATTSLAFGVLAFAHFRPLRELGLVVAAGILAILVASATVGAATLVLIGSRPTRAPGWLWRTMGRVVEWSVHLSTRYPLAVLTVAAALTAVALWGSFRLEISPDLRSLRPSNHPVIAAEELLVSRFGVGTDTATAVVYGADLGEALDRARRVERLLREQVGTPVQIDSPASWLGGADTTERLRSLLTLPVRRAADDLERELVAAGLAPAGFAPGLTALRELAAGRDPAPPDEATWPDWVEHLVRVGPESTAVAVRIRLPSGTWPDGPPAELLDRLAATAPGTALASAVRIGSDLRLLARRDLAHLSLFALAAVGLVVTLSFRGRPMVSVLAVVPVVLGSLWTLGLFGAAGRTIDLLGVAVLPIMLGIGIDDGLHAMHGAVQRPDRGIAGAVANAGRAMVLTTLTTCAGFGSLALSHVPGLRTGGLLVAAGVLACLAATLVVLPALEAVFSGRSDGGPRLSS